MGFSTHDFVTGYSEVIEALSIQLPVNYTVYSADTHLYCTTRAP